MSKSTHKRDELIREATESSTSQPEATHKVKVSINPSNQKPNFLMAFLVLGIAITVLIAPMLIWIYFY